VLRPQCGAPPEAVMFMTSHPKRSRQGRRLGFERGVTRTDSTRLGYPNIPKNKFNAMPRMMVLNENEITECMSAARRIDLLVMTTSET